MQVTSGANQKASFKEDRRLNVQEKIAAALGGMTGVLHTQMISMFILFYYTDVMQINPGYVAGLLLISRIVGAALIPPFGIVVDKVSTPWGKYVPWFMILGVPIAIFGWLTFTDFNFGPTGTLIYATVTYLIYSILVSIKAAPFNAVPPAITKRVDDRVSLGQYSYFAIMIAAIIVTTVAQPAYKALGGGDDARGFSFLMGLIAIFCILASIYQVRTLKERYVIKPKVEEKNASTKEMFRAVFTDKNAVVVYIYVLAISLATGIRSAIMIHYFKYFFNNESLVVIFGVTSLIPTIIGVMISGKIIKRFGIKPVILACTAVNVITTAAVMVIPATSSGVVIFFTTLALANMFMGLATPAQSTMLPAAMDHTEWKTGISINGFMGSFQGVMQTIAIALSGSLAAVALSMIGYVPGAEQSNETIFGLKVLMGLIPAVIFLFTASVAWFDITEEKQNQIAKELGERRRKIEANQN
ncbi:MFS transporter [Saliterribacillus persicus]|uniref:GPH family glycoside/pentoside/hexuronide:cation symporter/probable glucitol transport protein GutA n=1 Tax=Saliterribacillus persicus TaxID=930114 RepID=A0A368YC31_9BACI|nr:glycoside-pentoside-hexuronide (GPH):cation symporter [Saliterribacillus persicus]RCW76998.1 GPH family glycoside/pentoside/hexuronide:cation symporter/probable glucitol transport protein GutA [Saliterribacillus persicus]